MKPHLICCAPLLALSLCRLVFAQSPDNCPPKDPLSAERVGMVAAMMVPGAPRPVITAADVARRQQAEALASKTDWAQLCRFRADNRLFTQSEVSAVFLGASTTEFWTAADPELFNDTVINRGIGGQTTQQLLLRFHQDVLSLKPRVLHLMASSNDILAASVAGGMTLESAQHYLDTMVTLARQEGITVILGSNFPTSALPWAPGVKPAPMVAQWNAWLKGYAAARKIDSVDYYALLSDESGGLPAALSNDGVHPNRVGYARLSVLVRSALRNALQQKRAKLQR